MPSMRSGVRIWGACKNLTLRSRPAVQAPGHLRTSAAGGRQYASNTKPPASGSNSTSNASDTIPEAGFNEHMSGVPSEPGFVAAAKDALKSEASESGTPSDALGDDALHGILFGARRNPDNSEAGLTPAQEETLYSEGRIPSASEAAAIVRNSSSSDLLQSSQTSELSEQTQGHRWPLPQRPFPDNMNFKQRYHPVLDQLSRLLMRDGKLSIAQRNLSMLMNHLRTSPAPIYSPKFPLLPGTPPAAHLPLNPILYLTVAIDSVAPLIRINRIVGAAGGGRALDMPIPIPLRVRRRQAFRWILDAVNNKPSKGSGRRQLPVRLAEEVIAIVEGRSAVWDKRKLVHKIGAAARGHVGKPIYVRNRQRG